MSVKMHKIIIFFGLCVIFSVSGAQKKRQVTDNDYDEVITDMENSQQCTTPDSKSGICTTLSNCQYLQNIYAQSGNSPQTQNFLIAAQRNCGNRNIQGNPVVCCKTQNRPGSRQPPITQKIQSSSRRGGKRCTDPNGVAGVCKGLKDCAPFIKRLQANPRDSSFASYLQLSNQVCRVPPPIVCCTTKSGGGVPQASRSPKPPPPKPSLGGTGNVNRLPTLAEGCGLSKNTFRKIVGGEPAKVGAWPWITLLGYKDSFGSSSFKCGGALVTQRHVLTAAHCIRTDLKFVRLGEHNLQTETETSYVDINIVKMARHSNYNSKDGTSDVAVLRLERGAPFTDFIRPACLPNTPQLRAKSYLNYTPFVAGWGKTQEGGKSSQVLQELQIPIHANGDCQELYQRIGKLASAQQFDKRVICAGVLAGGKDTCQGDSGGPLMIPEPYQNNVRFYVIGIVSYGIGCARPDIPGVYTNVANFMPWIEQQIADNS